MRSSWVVFMGASARACCRYLSRGRKIRGSGPSGYLRTAGSRIQRTWFVRRLPIRDRRSSACPAPAMDRRARHRPAIPRSSDGVRQPERTARMPMGSAYPARAFACIDRCCRRRGRDSGKRAHPRRAGPWKAAVIDASRHLPAPRRCRPIFARAPGGVTGCPRQWFLAFDLMAPGCGIPCV